MYCKASAYASFLMIITAVFLLITAQLALTSSELRVSRIHERYSGLYNLGIAAAESGKSYAIREFKEADLDILQEYMDRYDWKSQCELKDGAFILTGNEFWLAYQEVAQNYIQKLYGENIKITHESGINIEIDSKIEDQKMMFKITVTNSSQRPYVKNMIENKVTVQGKIIWNPKPPVYTLMPNFIIDEDMPDGKDISDFTIIRDMDYAPFILSEVHQI